MSRTKVVFITLLGVITILMTVSVRAGLFRHHVTVLETRALLHERLPLGASRQRVVTVLDSLKVEHSGFISEERAIYAIWRRTSISLISETAIQARFYFDEENRLSRYELEQIVINM